MGKVLFQVRKINIYVKCFWLIIKIYFIYICKNINEINFNYFNYIFLLKKYLKKYDYTIPLFLIKEGEWIFKINNTVYFVFLAKIWK